jgi:hypothetical protein
MRNHCRRSSGSSSLRRLEPAPLSFLCLALSVCLLACHSDDRGGGGSDGPSATPVGGSGGTDADSAGGPGGAGADAAGGLGSSGRLDAALVDAPGDVSADSGDGSPPVIHYKDTYPRLGGMNIGAKNYDEVSYQRDLAKLDVVILGFYRSWHGGGQAIQDAVRAIKAHNSKILVGQYTILNEAYDDPADTATRDIYDKLYAEDWWLRDAAGQKVQWTADYGAWEVNFTAKAPADASGQRYPEWLAKRDEEVFFGPVPEFDIWYFDNVMRQSRVHADFDRDGRTDDESSDVMQTLFREGMRSEWDAARRLRPNLLFMGNTDSDLSYPEYAGQLGAAYLEGMIGESWSLETWSTWHDMMSRYRAVIANTAAPHLVLFNAHGDIDDFATVRYGLSSCLMDDGYFSYTDSSVGYSCVPWFDEFGVDLGAAVDPPQQTAWRNGIYRRRFERGMVLVNPKGNGARAVTMDEAGYRRLAGSQAPLVNSGAVVPRDATVTLEERDGLLLLKE